MVLVLCSVSSLRVDWRPTWSPVFHLSLLISQLPSEAGVTNRITIVPSMEEAPIERSDVVFVDGPVVDPARLRKDCLFIDDAVKRTFRTAAIAALQPLRDPTGDPAAALQRARDRYRGAVTGLLRAAQDRGHQEPS